MANDFDGKQLHTLSYITDKNLVSNTKVLAVPESEIRLNCFIVDVVGTPRQVPDPQG